MQAFHLRTQQFKHAMLSRSVWMAALAVSVWGLNTLMLQRVEFEHQGTIAISQHRLAAMQKLAEKRGHGTPYRFIECQLDDDGASGESNSTQKHSDMRTVRLRVRAQSTTELGRLESFLLATTRPKHDSPESQNILREIRTTKWQAESMGHQLCRLPDEHSKLALLGAVSGDSDTHNADAQWAEMEQSSSVYKLAGYRSEQAADSVLNSSRDVPQGFSSDLAESSRSLHNLESALALEHSTLERKLLTLNGQLQSSRDASAGYLSFTGAQRQYPVVHPIGWERLTVTTLMGLSLWSLVAIGVMRLPNARMGLTSLVLRAREHVALAATRGTSQTRSKRSLSKELSAAPKSSKVPIPFLGEIAIPMRCEPIAVVPELEETNELSLPAVSTRHDDCSVGTTVLLSNGTAEFKRLDISGRSNRQPCSVIWLQNLSSLCIAMWCMLFTVRFLADNVWRELFLASPFAGLTHLLAGVS